MELRTQPRDARVGVPIGTPPVVELLDRDDQPITEPGWTVRAAVISGPGLIAAGEEAVVVNGVATFSNLVMLGPTGGNMRLGFQLFEDGVAAEEVGVVADTFRLMTGPPTSITPLPPTEFTGAPGQLVSPSPSVLLRDASGNVVAGVPVTFSIFLGEGRITGPVESVTDAQGVATVSGWVFGLPGQNELRAAASTPTGPAPVQVVEFTALVSSNPGMLRIRLTGSPAGSTARVRVLKTSAAGTIHDVTYDVRDSLTVTGLPFGTYQVSGDSIKVANRIWLADASATGLNVAVTSGPSITLNYREHGRFEITTRGLPGPTQTATMDFLPTAGEFAQLFSVTTLNDAITRGLGPIGTYDLVPRVVVVGGQQFAATPPRQSVVLSGGGATPQLTVNYSVTTGTLVVTLDGTLPAGAAPQIDVTGPGGFRETVFMSGTRTWTGLAPGTYTIVASQITVSGALFRPTPVTSVANVTAGTTTTVTITYNP
jgi:hypothetical protein